MRADLEIAGIAFRLEGLEPSQSKAIRDGWPELLRPRPSQAPTVLDVRVYDIPASNFPPKNVKDEPIELTLDLDHYETHTEIRGTDLKARIAWNDDLTGDLGTYRKDPDYFRGVLENFLRVAVAHALVLKGGVLVHGAVVYDEASEHGLLFFGPSGAGKSTVSRLALAAGRPIASDDLNPIVRSSRNGFLAGGSPFIGDVGTPSEPPRRLKGIYRLEQSPSDSVRPMGPAETVASLVACAPFVNRSPHLRERLWSNLESLAASVPSHVLSFRREGGFWPLIDLAYEVEVERESFALPSQG